MSRYKLKKKKTPAEEIKQEVKKVNVKLWLITFISIAVIFAVYQVAVILCFEYIVHIYAVLLFITAMCYGIINRGFSNRKIGQDDLPSDWDTEKKLSFIEDIEKRRKKAKLFLIPLIGILVTLAYDMIFLFYIDPVL